MKWSLLRKQGCHKVTTVPSPPVCCCLIVALWWRWGGLESGCWRFWWGGWKHDPVNMFGNKNWMASLVSLLLLLHLLYLFWAWLMTSSILIGRQNLCADSSSVQIFSTSSSVFNRTWIIMITFWLIGWLLTSSQCLNCEYRFLWL